MKKVIFLFAVIAFVSCKNDKKTEEETTATENLEKTEKQSDGLTLLKGEFIYYTSPKDTIGAAVLQTHSEIYAVVINDKMRELNEQVQKYKTEDTDMVPVEIRGKITPKPENEEGWGFRVEIKEILNVIKPNPENNEIITIGKE
ncbi:MAG: hypothetical protein GXO84_05620 [Chlorobi bacterium]|nr:hypothetical protein [Chlorobiota bacterium]